MKRGSVEVVVEATYFSDGYSRHMDIFPAVLLAPVRRGGRAVGGVAWLLAWVGSGTMALGLGFSNHVS